MHWSRSLQSLLLVSVLLAAPGALTQTDAGGQTTASPADEKPQVPNTVVANPAVLDKSQLPSPSAVPVQLRFVVVLDPGHGGQDVGARLGAATLEKDVVLSISTRLRALLNAKGVPVVVTRDSDTSPTADERAAVANRARAAACLSLHATATGTGVHLFTTSLSPSNPVHGEFIPWNEAQATAATQSIRLASEVNTALGNEKLPVLLGRTALRPLNSFTCPAVAVELAPLDAESGAPSLADPAYQARVANALAAALIAWRVDWRQRP